MKEQTAWFRGYALLHSADFYHLMHNTGEGLSILGMGVEPKGGGLMGIAPIRGGMKE